ncbi:hypothetical protein PIB30_081692 [Stylosanthes scabra]|uniref:Uncharacterized protein n=1 Tax=Stylosanthes scabra TaxID=79078 RepID=A0ABU6WUJ8_9FABA|nr:hypothetical protein [Stylosanthes scabra]
MNVLRVMLRESKRHEGACRANDPAYDNSGLADIVSDWGVFGLTSLFTGRYIRNIKERNPQYVYDNEKDRKRLGHRARCPRGSASDSGPGLVLDRSGLAKVTDRKDRKRLGHRARCPRGSTSDSCPGLVLDRSGLAKVTDRVSSSSH